MLGAFILHIFPTLDGTLLSGINSHSNEKDPRNNEMLGWIAIKNWLHTPLKPNTEMKNSLDQVID